MPTAHSLFLNFESLLIKDFQDHLEKKGASRVTRKNYISDIRNFLSRVSLSDTAEDLSGRLNKYIVESSRIYSPATLKRKLSSLRIFCNWAFEKEYLKENPLVQHIGRSVDQPLRYTETQLPRPSDIRVPMPKELTAPYTVKGAESLFLHRVKITTAAVSGFGSVFVLLFIAKSIFGDALIFGRQEIENSLIFGPGAGTNQGQKTETLSFGDLLTQTPTVLGVSTQKTSVLSQSTAQGTATLSANSREIALYSPNLTRSSQITVIPENSIESAIFVAKAYGNYFTVAVDRPIPSDIPFTWEIVELQNTQ